jgi:hypothetical protein
MYLSSVSKSLSFVFSTWPAFIMTCVVALPTVFLNPAWLLIKVGCLRDPRMELPTRPGHDCGSIGFLCLLIIYSL